MTNNRIKGEMTKAAGSVQKTFGKAVDSDEHIVKGQMKKTAGKVQAGVGKLGQKLS